MILAILMPFSMPADKKQFLHKPELRQLKIDKK